MNGDVWSPEDAPYSQWLADATGLVIGAVAMEDSGKWRASCPLFYHLQAYDTRDQARSEVERVIAIKREEAARYK